MSRAGVAGGHEGAFTGEQVDEPADVGEVAPAWVSDAVVDQLRRLGVRFVALTPGSSFRGLHDSLVNYGRNRDPQVVLCLYEGIAVAHGYAKATGGVGVAALHNLVGLMNGPMALYNAWCDRTPLLVLGGGGPATAADRRPIDWTHSANSIAARDRGEFPVGIIGDGDLLMAAGALWTAVHHRLPLLAVVNNNRSFGNDEQHQEAVAGHRGRPVANAWIGTRIGEPAIDMATTARSYGAWAAGPVQHPDALPEVLGEAVRQVRSGAVAVVDVVTAPG